MEKKNGVMTSTYKEIGYSCSPKSPMIECKSSGDNNDDGVIELKVIDSKPVIIIKALSYPGCTHDWYMNPPFGGLTLIGIRS